MEPTEAHLLMKLMESTTDEQNERAVTTDSERSDQVREKR